MLEDEEGAPDIRVMKSPLWHEALVLPSDHALGLRGTAS